MSPFPGYNDLMKVLKTAPNEADKPLKIALLADFATQHLANAIRAAGKAKHLLLDIWEADYGTMDAMLMNQASQLYSGEYRYILVFLGTQKAYREFSIQSDKEEFAKKKLESLHTIVAQLTSKMRARIILSNYTEYDDGVFGNFANKTAASFLYQLRKINLGLMELAGSTPQLFINDIQSLQARIGQAAAFDPRLYLHADMIYGLDFTAQVALNTVDIIAAAEGQIRKCIVLDLDNTLWGGIIGDDGIDAIELDSLGAGKAFTDFQYWLRNLKERGIILAVCSKNTEHIAREAFERHPSMILKTEDIAVFMANWSPKAQNIAAIRSVLNIAYDAMVFLDDDPVEREMIRQSFPEISVPDLPDDPALYVEYLRSLNLFETTSYTPADPGRTRQYQEAAGRAAAQQSFESLDAFLQSLKMKASVKTADAFTIPRIAQLTQRSNQFNLRTQRYSAADIERMAADEHYHIISIGLKDRFGDYGLISVLVLRREDDNTLFIDTWIMSCRVLKRGVEALALNEAVSLAKVAGAQKLIGEYLPTAKNGIVNDHYADLGFIEKNGRWELGVENYQPKEHFISITEEQYAR